MTTTRPGGWVLSPPVVGVFYFQLYMRESARYHLASNSEIDTTFISIFTYSIHIRQSFRYSHSLHSVTHTSLSNPPIAK